VKSDREEEIVNSCARSGAKRQQPPPTPKAGREAASASGSGVSAAPFPGAGHQSPLWTSGEGDAESVPDEKIGKSAEKRRGNIPVLPKR